MPLLTIPRPPVQIPDFLPPILEDRSHSEIPKFFIRAFFQNGFDILPKEVIDFHNPPIDMFDSEPTEEDYLLFVRYHGIHETAIHHGFAYPLQVPFLAKDEIPVDGKKDMRLETLLQSMVHEMGHIQGIYALVRLPPLPTAAIRLDNISKNPFCRDGYFIHRYSSVK